MKINFTFTPVVPGEAIARNVAHNKSLGLPGLGQGWSVSDHVAFIGGDPFVASKLDEIRAFNGDIWAVNGAWRMCRDAGIDAAFITIDPSPEAAELARGASRAILASTVDPSAIKALASNARVEMFDVGIDDVVHGPTTATAVPHLAIVRGSRRVSFYGCASCFDGARTHAYKSAKRSRLLIETCRGLFETSPDMLGQAEFLAEIIRAAPDVYSERSGGLLGALVQSPDYDITAATRNIHEAIA